MNNITPSDNFFFTEYKYDKYHYTDNTKGSPMNYIGFMATGTAKIVSDEKTLFINTGDLFFIPKRLSYKSYWYGEKSIELLSLGFLNIEARVAINCVLQTVNCSDEIKNLVISIPTDGRYPKCETLARFYYALSKILPNLEKAKKPTKAEAIVDTAKKYIFEHTDCSVSDIAKHCLVSEPYLFLCFKNKSDMTPNEYRLKVISQKGSQMLATTDKTVEEISSTLGLSSAAHFRKILKKHTGLSPKEIRKNSGF